MVSTSTQPIARSRSKSPMVTPNAGMMTTSSAPIAEKSNSPSSSAGQERDAHGPQLLVHVRIVDDLAHQEQPPVGELEPGLVGVVHRAIHPVAEAELARQPEGERPDVQPVVAGAQQLDHGAVVVGGELALDRGLEPEAAAEIGAFHDALIYTRLGVRAGGGAVEQPRVAGRSRRPSNDPADGRRTPSPVIGGGRGA